jgi:hypothetical protein
VDSAWEGIFMLLVLKIPLIYLAAVVWWAIRAEPATDDGSGGDGALVSLSPCGWEDWKRGRRGRGGGRGRRPIRPNGHIPRLRAQRARASAS